MERPLLAVGASVLLHALACGAMVSMKMLFAPVAITPPRVLYVVLPEADAAGRPLESGAFEAQRAKARKDTGAVRRSLASVPGGTAQAGAPAASPETEIRPALAGDLRSPAPAAVSSVRAVEPRELSPVASGERALPRLPSPDASRQAASPVQEFELVRSSSSPGGQAEIAAALALMKGGLDGTRPGSVSATAETPAPDGRGGAGLGGTDYSSEGLGGSALTALPPSGGPSASAVPRYKENATPAYPWRARLRGEQGVVLVAVRVTTDGWVGEVVVHRSSGSALLDEAAVAAVTKWRFHPARRGDQPAEAWVNVPIRFRLED